MDMFDLPADEIPRILYRVQYRDSRTAYWADGGLEAEDIDTRYNEEDLVGFSDAVQRHLNWDRQYMTMFISLFSDRRHAENWMLKRHSRFHDRDCTLLEIDMNSLRDHYVFRAEEIVDALSLSIRTAAQASVAKEYLVVHCIPPIAVLRSQTVHDITSKRTLSLNFRAWGDINASPARTWSLLT
jgi:hypothetical protein